MGSGCRQRVSDVYWSHKVEYKCPESMKKIGQQVVYMEMLDLFVDQKPGLGAPPFLLILNFCKKNLNGFVLTISGLFLTPFLANSENGRP